jgi:hypothetical protein
MRSVVAVGLNSVNPSVGLYPLVGTAVMGTAESCAGEPT